MEPRVCGGRPKGFGYVEFDDLDAAKNAYEGLGRISTVALSGSTIHAERLVWGGFGSGRGHGFGGGGRGGRFSGGRGGGGGRGDSGPGAVVVEADLVAVEEEDRGRGEFGE
ncbi:hypothetical protein D9757_015473 [Collybiopsis confluens]|uniref:RRM domain-containing protein n=1 Tax=Collybiopsis confluens TaxID=2823264 RepID=A0A8H5CGW2_9AGAR|nr:hypothetical protein D9757_015473 [Collybiopsis confluens]